MKKVLLFFYSKAGRIVALSVLGLFVVGSAAYAVSATNTYPEPAVAENLPALENSALSQNLEDDSYDVSKTESPSATSAPSSTPAANASDNALSTYDQDGTPVAPGTASNDALAQAQAQADADLAAFEADINLTKQKNDLSFAISNIDGEISLLHSEKDFELSMLNSSLGPQQQGLAYHQSLLQGHRDSLAAAQQRNAAQPCESNALAVVNAQGRLSGCLADIAACQGAIDQAYATYNSNIANIDSRIASLNTQKAELQQQLVALG